MSGVLDRMAKRALGALPTVQPLMAPRYAQMREEPSRSAAELERSVETEAEAPVRMNEAGSGTRRPETGEFEWREDRSGTATESVRGLEARIPAEQQGHATAQPAAQRELRTRQDRESEPAGAARVAEPAPRLKLTGRWPESSVPTLGKDRPSGDDADGSTALGRDESRRGTANSRQSRGEQKISEFSALPARRSGQERTRQVVPPAEEKTEINISIGSIEMRAPRVEQRPQPAPFRPRVTLDEFLRRKPGARA
jgi:hypothetical protein